ncbi:AbrB/MazE/SpoVT family DNA-binding domain-containing protein [Variovorax sp. DT-64]|uniref:AbrB/MazE/SpoVT family DNA-binding domain-containing protein n=1 Tax=Variovorax sp. DT-64 TaxID=3396160 RepID=UPI003F193C51
MHVMVKKWGNSASVRIPAAVMEAARLHLDDTVDAREEEGRIVIEPVRSGEFELTKLLARITPGNRPEYVHPGTWSLVLTAFPSFMIVTAKIPDEIKTLEWRVRQLGGSFSKTINLPAVWGGDSASGFAETNR